MARNQRLGSAPNVRLDAGQRAETSAVLGLMLGVFVLFVCIIDFTGERYCISLLLSGCNLMKCGVK